MIITLFRKGLQNTESPNLCHSERSDDPVTLHSPLINTFSQLFSEQNWQQDPRIFEKVQETLNRAKENAQASGDRLR